MLVAAAGLVCGPALGDGPREEVCLNGFWDFQPAPRGELSDPNPAAWVSGTMIVPSWWKDVEEFEYPEAWKDAPCAWYRRRLPIMPRWDGKRLLLHFDAVAHVAQVRIDGEPVGEHLGGFTPFEVDITDHVTAGQECEIAVGVRDWDGLNVDDKFIAPVGENPRIAGIWQDVFLRVLPPLHIDDVFVMTSTRKQRITGRVTVSGAAEPQKTYTIQCRIDEDPTVRFVPMAILVEPGESVTRDIVATWPSPKLWSPESPNLYYMTVELRDLDGTLLDEVQQRFGYREFWCDGAAFYLNGKRINLHGDSVNRLPNMYRFTRKYMRMFYETAKSANMNTLRFHTAPNPPALLDLADEMGILITDEGAVMNWTHNAYDRPDHFLQFYREWIRRDRNHPSVVIWSPANEVGMPRMSGAPLRLFRQVAELIKELDPTRPIEYEGSGGLAGEADILSYHYPYELDREPLVPDSAYWLVDGERAGDWERWDRKRPLSVGEFTPSYYAFPSTLYAYAGDRVYENLLEDAGVHYEALADILRLEVEGFRAAEVAKIAPWCTVGCYAGWWFNLDVPLWFPDDPLSLTMPGYTLRRAVGNYSCTLNPFDATQPTMRPTPLLDAVSEAFEPVTVFIRERDSRFYEGDIVKRTWYAFNDTPNQLIGSLDLEAHCGDRANMQRKELRLGPGERATGEFAFRVPPVDRETPLTLTARITAGAQTLWDKEWTYTAFPDDEKDRPAPTLPDGRVFLYDPAGETAPILDRVRMPFEILDTIRSFALAPMEARRTLVIVGKDGLARDPAAAEAVDRLAAAGATVLIFEQPEQTVNSIWQAGGNHRAEPASRAFPVRGVREMSRDLSEEDFLYWRGDHRVTRAAPYLMRPAVRALVTCGSGSGSVLAPLFEFPAGDGRLIVCQMLVIEKFATEPAAAKLLRAVLTYASGRVAPRPAVRVVGDRPGPVISVLDAAGVAYILRDTAPSPRALYLIDGRSAAAHQLNRRGDVLGGLLSGGATALVVEPDEETLDLLNGQLAGQTTLTLVQPSIRHQQLEFADDEEPLTAGIARRTLFWEHETQERAPAQPIARRMLEVEGRATILVREPEWTAPWANAWGGDAMQHMVTTHQRIEQPGAALVEIPVGRGRLVVSTISMSPQEEHSVRFYAQLLFNLGAGFRR